MKINLHLTDEELGNSDDFELCETAWQKVSDAYWNSPDGKKEHEVDYPESIFASNLPEHWWAAYAIHAFEYDFHSGSIQQFLDNHDGLLDSKMMEAFKLVEAVEYVPFYEKAAAIYRKKKEQISELEGDAEYESIDCEYWTALIPINKGIDELMKRKDSRGFLADYIRRNRSKYQES